MLDVRKVFDWISHVDDGGEDFAGDLADMIDDLAEIVQTSVTVQTHSEEYARNRAIEKIREVASEIRAHRID